MIRKDTLIVVPAHNEASNISHVVEDIRRHAPAVDVVIVNDGSSDDTAALAEAAGAQVLNLPINLGIGGAVQTGFQFATKMGYAFSMQVDGDGQHPADMIEAVLAPVRAGEADACIGSRFIEKDGFQSTGARRLGIRMFRWVGKLVTGHTFTDATSGFRAYNAEATAFLAENYSTDYPEVEAIITLCRNGFRVTEVPVTMRERQGGRSSINMPRSVYYMIKVMLASLISNVKPVRRNHT